jgi:glutathione S-transferase
MPGEEREEKLKQLVYQLDVVEATCKGPYMAGLEVTGADATWLGTMVFLTEILPRVFHWGSVFQGRPKLAAWWALMQQDPAAAKVRRKRGRVGLCAYGVGASCSWPRCHPSGSFLNVLTAYNRGQGDHV